MELHAREVNQDVRELGELLGDIITEQSSESAFNIVEQIRTAAVAYRRGEAEDRSEIHETLDGLSPEEQDVVARAFTTYFELINLAEERQRVREIREGSQEGTFEDSVRDAVEELAERDLSADTVEEVLEDVLIQPTFTAHPTEARRKTVKAKLRTVSEHLEELDEVRLTSHEERDVKRDLEAEVTSLWQTPQVRNRRPEVTDEALNVQWYLENVLFEVISEVYDALERAVEDHFDGTVDVPKLYEFRSWAGSDRDGNPFVTPEVTEETLDRQQSVALPLYRDR